MAIFILVVLSMLAAAMISIMAAGTDSVAREVLSARALMAAESGAQRNLNEIFTPGAAVDTAGCQAAKSYSGFAGLVGCSNVSVVVDCNFVTVNTVNYFTLTSVGRCGPVSDQAVRVIEVQAKDGL
jgi:MSHA biogenesis protein MshP